MLVVNSTFAELGSGLVAFACIRLDPSEASSGEHCDV
jgi:hypothetical protein